MKRYYITSGNGFVEVTEEEFHLMRGTDETRPYIAKVYTGEMAIGDVPAELQEAVRASIETKIEYQGLYAERELSAYETLEILTGGATE